MAETLDGAKAHSGDGAYRDEWPVSGGRGEMTDNSNSLGEVTEGL